MERLDVFIREKCPLGVEHKLLREISRIERGERVTKKDLISDGHYPVISGGVQPMGRINKKNRDGNTITISSYGAAGYIGYREEDFWANDVCLCVYPNEGINKKYLYYALVAQQEYIYSNTTKAVPDHIPTPFLLDLIIPVPPADVQNAIVEYLDELTMKFSELLFNLETELRTRKVQLAYYCKKIVEKQDGKKWVPLSDVGTWQGGMTPSMANHSYWENGSIPWVSSKDMKVDVLLDTEDHITQEALDHTSIKLLPENIVAVVARSGILKHTLPIVYVPIRTTINQDIKAVTTREDIYPKYVFYALKAYHDDLLLKAKKQGGTVDSLDIKKFMQFEIPIVSLDEQRKTIDYLDKLFNQYEEITVSIEEEIEYRKIQFQYYREKVFDFSL